MNYIYHEKQEGSLCAQHCLNNLLQDNLYSAIDLAEIANQMDQKELQHMAELGNNTEEYKRFAQQPSSNMDDSGMFSIQVLSSALKSWDLTLIPFASSISTAIAARNNPVEQQAFICNFKEHWFTVRKIGYQWFNLNSLLAFPELISDTYLMLFLTQLQHEGYSIFVIEGPLIPCSADEIIRETPVVQTIKPHLLSEKSPTSGSTSKAGEEDMLLALQNSLKDFSATQNLSQKEQNAASTSTQLSEDEAMARAIQMSLDAEEEDENERGNKKGKEEKKGKEIEGKEEKEELERALQMSLDQDLCEAAAPEEALELDLELLRQKRLQFLEEEEDKQ